MSNVQAFYYLLTSQIILLLLISMYAVYMVDLNCPSLEQIARDAGDAGYNETDPVNAITNVWLFLGLIVSGCAGIPWWIYIVIFIPAIIAMIVYIVPFVGG